MAEMRRDPPPFRSVAGEVNRGDRWLVVGTFGVLTFVVWGAFAFDRGLLGDDVHTLALVNGATGVFNRLFAPQETPTRVLRGVPYTFALLFSEPVLVLQLLYGATWFCGGLFSYLLLLALFPGERWLAYVGGCLTLCATGDFLVNCLGADGYELSAACQLASVMCLVRWWVRRSRRWFVAAAVFLSGSIWMSDVAVAAALLTPLVLWAAADFRLTRRLVLGALGWYCIMAPYLVRFVGFLRDPSGYAAVALLPMSWGARSLTAIMLFIYNFNPWAWGPGRRNWFPAAPPVIPAMLRLVLTAAGTLVFVLGALWLWRSSTPSRGRLRGNLRYLGLLALCFLMAFATNASYASVRAADAFLRTQIASRYWASMAVALVAWGIARRWPRATPLAFGLPALFVALGLYGGLDRQDYFLAFWQRHQNELRSIVRAVPKLRDGTHLLLHVPAGRPYGMAIEAEFAARSWTALLYDDASLYDRTVLWAPGRGTACTAQGRSLLCRRESGEEVRIPLNEMVLLTYDSKQNQFLLTTELPGDVRGEGSSAIGDYQPANRVLEAPLTSLARGILYPPRFLARLLPPPAVVQ